MVEPAKAQFKGALCTFFLQENCKKETTCNFAHERISKGEIPEYDDIHLEYVVPAKFLSFVGCSNFEIQPQLLTKPV